MNNFTLTIIILFFSFTLKGQINISLEQAVEKALENNNIVKIAKKNTEIAENSATIGNAGLLPTVVGNGNSNVGLNNSKLQFVTAPEPLIIPAARSSGYGTNLQANYILFGGFAAQYNFKRLKLNKDAASIQERVNIESIVMQVAQSYYGVLQSQINLKIQKTALEISKERLIRAQVKNELAGGSKIDFLNAKVDFNTDSISFINAQNNHNNALLKLKQVVNTNESLQIDTTLTLNTNLNLEELKTMAQDNNASLLNSEYNIQLAIMNTKISQSSIIPKLSINGTYNFNHSENEASVVTFSENSGFSGALQLSIPIWDGSKKNIEIQNTKTNLSIAELNKYEAESVLNRDLETAFANYKNAITISNLDKLNIETAELNFERSNELFKVGQINNTDFRTAQLNLLRIKNQASVNKINIKLAEIELLRLSGQLLN